MDCNNHKWRTYGTEPSHGRMDWYTHDHLGWLEISCYAEYGRSLQSINEFMECNDNQRRTFGTLLSHSCVDRKSNDRLGWMEW